MHAVPYGIGRIAHDDGHPDMPIPYSALKWPPVNR